MPVYLWVIVPMVILFLASLMHMIVYGLKLKLEISRWQKDSLNLQDSIKSILLGKTKRYTIKHKELQDIAQALQNSQIKVDSKQIQPLKTNALYLALESNDTIYSGGYIQLPRSGYTAQSPLLIQNQLNRLEHEGDFAKQVIKNRENYNKTVLDKAIGIYAKTVDPKEFTTISDLLNTDALQELIKRVANKNFIVDQELATTLYKKCNKDLELPLTKALIKQLEPQTLLDIFAGFEQEGIDMKECYIYTLLEFEMLEKAREILIEYEGFEHFKAYLDLIDLGKRYPLHLFVR